MSVKDDLQACGKLPKIPDDGDFIIVIGDPANCPPCADIERFIIQEGEDIKQGIFSIKEGDFNKCFPEAKVVSVPKILFMHDGLIVDSQEGFGSIENFKEKIRAVFGV